MLSGEGKSYLRQTKARREAPGELVR